MTLGANQTGGPRRRIVGKLAEITNLGQQGAGKYADNYGT